MSVLLFGVSHRSAPVSVLEQLSTDEAEQAKIVEKVLQSSLVTEAMVLSTCNRVEVYAVVEAFHGGLSVIGQVLSEHSGMGLGDLTKYAYVRYAEAAVEHLFAVASGLDSAVIGEQQVLGQVRRAYADRRVQPHRRPHAARTVPARTVGRQAGALRDGHRRRGRLGGVGGAEHGRRPSSARWRAARAVVVGAGSMGSLSAKYLARLGVDRIHIVNRSLPRAKRLADNIRELGVAAEAFPFDHLPPVLTDADVLVCCTGAVRPVVSLADVHRGLAHGQEPKQLVICDLGMPRDVDPAVAGLPGVFVIDMDRIQREPSARAAASDAEAARAIVAAEVANYLAGQRMAEVTPTVTALRQRAADVVEAELLRLDNRLPGLEAAHRDEVAKTVRRVVDKLLHAPTVRVKQLASAPGGDSYAEALRELFELDQQAVDAVAAGELPLMAPDLDKAE